MLSWRLSLHLCRRRIHVIHDAEAQCRSFQCGVGIARAAIALIKLTDQWLEWQWLDLECLIAGLESRTHRSKLSFISRSCPVASKFLTYRHQRHQTEPSYPIQQVVRFHADSLNAAILPSCIAHQHVQSSSHLKIRSGVPVYLLA